MPPLYSICKALAGLSPQVVIHAFKRGPRLAARASVRAYYAVLEDEMRSQQPPPSPYTIRQIPEVNLSTAIGEAEPEVTIKHKTYVDGMLPSEQAFALVALLAARRPSELLEIGTYLGHTTRQMAENAVNALIHTVDLPLDFNPENERHEGPPKDDFHLIRKRQVGKGYLGYACADRIQQHFADTASWDFAPARNATFFFIDGSHTYEHCLHDSQQCLTLNDKPKTLVWHDCDDGHPGVVRCLVEWRSLGRDIKRIRGTSLAYWDASGVS